MTEKTDLTLNVGNYVLNVRATAVIIHDGKILIHHNKIDKHYVLIGGRVKIGEDSATTIKREIEEELGRAVEVKEYLATIENFFEKDGKKFHEYMFVYKCEFADDKDKEINYTLKNIEGEDEIEYIWIDLKDLSKYNILPTAVNKILKEEKQPVHIINKEK